VPCEYIGVVHQSEALEETVRYVEPLIQRASCVGIEVIPDELPFFSKCRSAQHLHDLFTENSSKPVPPEDLSGMLFWYGITKMLEGKGVRVIALDTLHRYIYPRAPQGNHPILDAVTNRTCDQKPATIEWQLFVGPHFDRYVVKESSACDVAITGASHAFVASYLTGTAMRSTTGFDPELIDFMSEYEALYGVYAHLLPEVRKM
jgi:hypothetical protein